MFSAIAALAMLGLGLGYLLGVAAIHLRVEQPAIVEELEQMLPGSNRGQCGFPGCAAGAVALAEGEVPVSFCPPGGKPLAQALADKLGVSFNADEMQDEGPQVARIIESRCIGCTRCFKVCPTDAVIGAPKQMHSVISEACIGCNKCTDICPTWGIELRQPTQTLSNWQWPKPAAVAQQEACG